MTEPVVTEIDIAATPEEVWAVVMDVQRLGEWVSIHKKLGRHSAGVPVVGAWMEQTLVLRGARFKVRWELTRCQAPHLAEWSGKGPARSKAKTGYRLEATDSGTRFHYHNEFRAPLGPLGAFASRALVGGLPQKEAQASLTNLRRLLEG